MAYDNQKGMRLASRRLPYLPGLDGLRAIAVIAVLVYHAEARWLPGGFLGVEVFFVISGYLVTALLLAIGVLLTVVRPWELTDEPAPAAH